MYYVYIVRCADTTYYTGITTDVTRRVSEHNHDEKGARYTAVRRPVELVYVKALSNRSSASQEEARIKKLSRADKHTLIDEWHSGT